MKTPHAVLAVLPVLALVQSAHATNWQRILTCDNGGAWVDVNADDRQKLQLVVRNREANRFFIASTLSHEALVQNGGDWEMVFPGFQRRGVFAQGDFSESALYKTKINTLPIQLGDAHVYHYVADLRFFLDHGGLKLELVRRDLIVCNSYDGRTGDCAGGTHHEDERYVGNWWFPDCR